jgi:hypothetical protein
LGVCNLGIVCSNLLKGLSISKRLAMFNALKYTHRLEAVGIPREQAEAQVQLVLDAIETEVATKSDLAGLRADIAEFKSEMKTEFAELKIHFVLRLGAAVVGSVAIAATIIGFLIKF